MDIGVATFSALGSLRPPPHGRGGYLCFGITEGPAAPLRGPLSLWDHRGPPCLGTTRPSPHRSKGFRYLGAMQTHLALAPGPPLLWYHQRCRLTAVGASFASGSLILPPAGVGSSFGFGQPRHPLHGCRGLFRFGIMEARAAWGPGRHSPWDPQGLYHIGAGIFSALGSWRPPPPGSGGLFCFGIIEVLATRLRGALSLWAHRGPPRLGITQALAPPIQGLRCYGTIGLSSHWHGGLSCFGIIKVPASRVWVPPSRRDHRHLLELVRGPHSVWKVPFALAQGPPTLWDHGSPGRMGAWAPFALGPRIHRFGIIEAPRKLAPGPPSALDYRGPRPIGAWAFFAFCLSRTPSRGRVGVHRFGTTEAPAA